MRYAQILSTGRYVPEKVVTNKDVEAIIGEPVDEWLQQNVGIKQRHFMADNQVTSDLCVEASKEALRRAGVSASELDLVVVATDTPDYLSPCTAAVVQAKPARATRASTT